MADNISRVIKFGALAPGIKTCLLYTSDAADERSSVDLGGRRIIKKKKNEKIDIQTRERYSKYKVKSIMEKDYRRAMRWR